MTHCQRLLLINVILNMLYSHSAHFSLVWLWAQKFHRDVLEALNAFNYILTLHTYINSIYDNTTVVGLILTEHRQQVDRLVINKVKEWLASCFWGPTSVRTSETDNSSALGKKGSKMDQLSTDGEKEQPVCRAAQSLLPLLHQTCYNPQCDSLVCELCTQTAEVFRE